ncbi:type IV pilus modification PilV family protein [Candidatus Enterococcus clewellii]|nr:prepilin-type N-terminal cleavage/methylation domain-containing protein [Enterococcus sp. 9E7_DIV0242]
MKKHKRYSVKRIYGEKLKRMCLDEHGFSLLEVLFAIVILGVCFLFIASLIYQNNQAIQLNTKKEEAIFAREDVKEWLLYKAQIQDVANLNTFVFVETSSALTAEQTERREHLILDNSGIQKDSGIGRAKYGELEVPVNDSERGVFIQKIKYRLTEPEFLPEALRSSENQLYLGQYIDRSGEETDYLVKVVVRRKEGIQAYNPRTDGVGLTIQVYDRIKGNLLTETYINWVAES